MSAGFKIAIGVIIISAAALFYGLRPAPAHDTVFPIAKKQTEKRIEKADVKISEIKKHAKKSAKKIEEISLIAIETEAAYVAIKETAAPVEDKLAAADVALAACDTRADALVDHVDYLNAEISAHEEKETALGDEVELFSARIDALESENTALRRQLFWMRAGVVGILAGGFGLWALAL